MGIVSIWSLLRSALYSFTTSVHLVIVLVCDASCNALAFSCWVDLLERVVLGHGIWRWDVLWLAWREHTFESFDLLWCERSGVAVGIQRPRKSLWEFDIELDVHVAVVVVPVGWHALTADDLDLA